MSGYSGGSLSDWMVDHRREYNPSPEVAWRDKYSVDFENGDATGVIEVTLQCMDGPVFDADNGMFAPSFLGGAAEQDIYPVLSRISVYRRGEDGGIDHYRWDGSEARPTYAHADLHQPRQQSNIDIEEDDITAEKAVQRIDEESPIEDGVVAGLVDDLAMAVLTETPLPE